MECLEELVSHIRAVQTEYGELVEELESTEAAAETEQEKMEDDRTAELRQQYEAFSREIMLLAKAVPEGNNLEDQGLSYFLTIAELQQNIQELKSIKTISRRNLDFLRNRLQETDNLRLDHDERNTALHQKVQEMSEGDGVSGVVSEETKMVLQKLDKKVRATRVVYKEMRNHLGQFLLKVSAESDCSSTLAHLLQDLWDIWNDRKGDYLRISHLEHDVNEADVAQLKEAGIIQCHQDDKDLIRLVDFTK